MEFSAKIVECIQPFTIFAKRSMLSISQGYEYVSNKSKQKHGLLSFTWQKVAISADFVYFEIQSYLHIITLRWNIIDYKFNTRAFVFKLIYPYSWIHMTLASHQSPAQTHHNIFRPTLCNFFDERKEIQCKSHSIVLTLLQWVCALSAGAILFCD